MKKRVLSFMMAVAMIAGMVFSTAWPAFGAPINANDDSVVLNQTLIPATENAPAKIRLEAYTLGTMTTSQQRRPADIVLVLDQSGSMEDRVNGSTKLSLLKTATRNFISEIAKMNDDTGSLYRIAVAGFASRSGYGNNTELLTAPNGNGYGVAYDDLRKTHYQQALVNCTADSAILSNAISSLDANGATRADLGMEMAAKIFENQPADTYKERSKIVVLITDGEPTTNNSFSSNVANAAIGEAKTLKEEDTHIFSMYIGTPSTNAGGFMQAVSSNYPDATAYNKLGTKADDTYYSAYTDALAIEKMLTTVVSTISALSSLNENSVITGIISRHFMLAADVQTTGLDQIEVYTVDKTKDGWAGEEVPYGQAKVQFVGEGSKTIGVTGFNFAANCITQIPRNNDFYGRKLVIYIPIVEDPSDDTFGGWLPASDGAAIYQDLNALVRGESTASASSIKSDVTLGYTIAAAERAYHVDGTLLSEEAVYQVSFLGENGIAESVFDEMIPHLPDAYRNTGVSITYKLFHIGTNVIDSNDGNDDTLLATITVPVADLMDVTDPAKWTWTEGLETVELTIPANEYFTEKVYVLVATLTNARRDGQPDTLSVYNYLTLSAVRGDLAHIVYGVIDENGKTEVPAGVAGQLVGNTYTEAVTEKQDSAVITFTPNVGYRIRQIVLFTSQNAPFDTQTVIYSTDPKATVTQVDLDGDGMPDEILPAADGSWCFGAKGVASGVAVEVYTEAITQYLTTDHDAGSEIVVGFGYSYSDEKTVNVPFRALNGYAITALEIDGVVYDLTKEAQRQALTDTYEAVLTAAESGEIFGGSVEVACNRNHHISVISQRRVFRVYFRYFRQMEDGSIIPMEEMSQPSVVVTYGATVMDKVEPAYIAGDELEIDGAVYSLNGWYVGNGFSEVLDETLTMPAQDLILQAVWTKVPTYQVQGTIDDNGDLTVSDNADGLLEGNAYTEVITQGRDSATMTFVPDYGYQIREVYMILNEGRILVYSAEQSDAVVPVDLNCDGTAEQIQCTQDGGFTFQVTNVGTDVTIAVYTAPVTKRLTTSGDNNSVISEGKQYLYDTEKTEKVTFRAAEGYQILSVEIDGVMYLLGRNEDLQALTQQYGAEFTMQEGVILSGSVEVSCDSDHAVSVAATAIPVLPKTGDGIGVVAAMMVFAAVGLAAILLQKKRFHD